MEKKPANWNIHKAVGLDNFSNWILRDFVVGPIAAIANTTLRQRLVLQPRTEADMFVPFLRYIIQIQ